MSISPEMTQTWIKTVETLAQLWLCAVIDNENGVTHPDRDDPE